MKTETTHHGSGSELRAFAAFYGATLLCAVILHTIAAAALPATLLHDRDMFVWTLSFLVGCGICSWSFERYRKSTSSARH